MSVRRLFGLLGCLVMIVVPALACNLPAQQPLAFPTSAGPPSPVIQPQSTAATLAWPTPSPQVLVSPLPPQASPSAYGFWGLQTATPGPGQPAAWGTPEAGAALPSFTYWTQPGDTLPALARRFGVPEDQIVAPVSLPAAELLPAGLQLTIPNVLGQPPYPSAALPDSLVIYSATAAEFDIQAYVAQAGGYLSTYTQELDGEVLSGAQIVRRIALETSINPRLLLAFLEFRSGWVLGSPADPALVDYPIGFYVPEYQGLYLELSLVAKQLNIGYYGWRQGTLVELVFPDGSQVRISPGVNAGTAAVQTLTSKFYRQQVDWLNALYGARGLLWVYEQLFGDPWQAAAQIEPLFPAGLAAPGLELPFAPGERWSLTSGPHIAWTTGTPRGALDFAPITGEPACAVSVAWVTASAPGLVVRAERGVVALDLDGDGLEQTGWVLIYMHVAAQDRVPLGTWVETDDPLGHPSCEGGRATGTHVHLARKYNGEWVGAEGPFPLVLSGWVAHAGERLYEGTLEKDGQVVTAQPDGSYGSTIVR